MKTKAKACPVCAKGVIGPHGNADSEILFICSTPTEDEMNSGFQFAGKAYLIFRKVLHQLAGLDLPATRQVSINYHPKGRNPDCELVSTMVVAKELKDKKYVILVGADAVRQFTGLSVDAVNGLDVTNKVIDSEELPTHDKKFFALCTPSTVFQSLGEFEFGLKELGHFLAEE